MQSIRFTPSGWNAMIGLRDFPDILQRLMSEYLSRGAQEAARLMKEKAPKAFSTLTNSINVEEVSPQKFVVAPHTNYAGYVEEGADPHMPPIDALVPWVKTVLRVADDDAYQTARSIAFAIKARGTRPQPYVQPTADEMAGRIEELGDKAILAAIQEAFA